MKKGTFDAGAFFSALDAQRIARRSNWKDVANQSGVSASTLTRMAQGRRPDVDSLAALVAWSGLNVNNYIREADEERAAPEPLAMISTHLRADRNLTEEGAVALEELIKATYERLRRD
jgi:transcriptional regulator with XRE-family HTH domain